MAKKHKFAKTFERLSKKYAAAGKKDFSETTQGKEMLAYLAGVPASKGGGLGAPDPTYGTGTVVTGQAEEARQALMKKMREAKTQKEAEELLRSSQKMAKDFRGLGEKRLASDQYFNYRQQLYQANPAAYEKVFPISSGKGIAKLVSPVTSMAKEAVKSIFGVKEPVTKKPDLEGMDPSLFWDLTSAQAPETSDSGSGGILEASLQGLYPDNLENMPDPGNIIPTDLLDIEQYPFTQNAFFKPNQSYYFGGGNYGLPNLLNPNQQLISLAGGGMVPGYAGGGMIPGYRGGGLMDIDRTQPDYSAFGRFILGNLPQGGVGNMARGIV